MRNLFLAPVFIILYSSAAYSQTAAITSPPEGSIFYPGNSVNVQVAAPQSSLVTVTSDLHFQVSPIFASQAPYSFNLLIPSNAAAGPHSLTAVIRPNPGSPPTIVRSQFSINVLAPAASGNLQFVPSSVYFRYPGQIVPLEVYFVAIGSNRTNVSYSPQLQLSSDNPSIGYSQGSSLIAGPAKGSATMTISFNGVVGTITLNNSSSGVVGDLNGDGKVDIDDLHIIEDALNTPANGPNDARDLNHDGKIDALDARILTTLCTYPHCATHP